MSLVNWNSIDSASRDYKRAKQNLNNIDEYISKTIEDNTQHELQALKKATEDYNRKIESILNSEKIKRLNAEAEKNYDSIKKSVKVAFETYKKVKKIIYEKKDLTTEEKKQYEHKLYQKLMDKFMTKEEKEIFEKIMTFHSSKPIIIMNRGITY